MNINSAFASNYIKSEDIEDDRDLVLTIRDVNIEALGQGDDADEKPVVTFHETPKKLVLNRTNANTIRQLYGSETDDWIGKRIALFATEVEFKGKMTMGLRVRTRAPKDTAARPGPAPAKGRKPAPAPAAVEAEGEDQIPF